MDTEKIVSDLDTVGKEVLKATASLLAEWQQKVAGVFRFVIDCINELAADDPVFAEYIRQRTERTKHYINRLSHMRKNKKRRRRRPKHRKKPRRRRH